MWNEPQGSTWRIYADRLGNVFGRTMTKYVLFLYVTRRADIVIGAVGKPKFIQAEWVKEGVILIDAGYNPGNIGDIDLDQCKEKCAAYTPVPGGVGPMTIISLIAQTIQSAEKSAASR